MTEPIRLGLYGGTFDPVHLGHLLVARAALEEFSLARIIFIPAAQSPFKPGAAPTPGEIRARMLRLALCGMPEASVDDQELRRGGISYSVDTARAYAEQNPGARVFWLIGADHVPSLPKWRDAETLAGLVEFLVIPRPGVTPVSLPPPFRLHALRGFPLALSSSEIRERARAGKVLVPFVPERVAELIQTERLYQG
jgi:nicotinate-nucleotide adenylyltransferase